MRTARHSRGFTSAELLMVLTLAAVVIGGVVVSYGTIVRNFNRVGSYVEVPLPSTTVLNYYGASGTSRTCSTAPSYGVHALADRLREQFWSDVTTATAVFCLARNGLNTYRPAWVPYVVGTDRELDTPQAFREHLITRAGIPATLFRSERGFSAPTTGSTLINGSIYILGYSDDPANIKVQAIYDIDFVKVNSPQGIYASVRRYAPQSAVLGATTVSSYTNGYEVFYPPSSATTWTTDGFSPLFVAFERSSRKALAEGVATDRFKQAAGMPFYMLWWPDPAARNLAAVPNSLPLSDVRSAYNHQGGRTGYMMVVPMFPAL